MNQQRNALAEAKVGLGADGIPYCMREIIGCNEKLRVIIHSNYCCAQEALSAERARGSSMQRRNSPPHDLSGVSDWRSLRPPAGPSAAGRQFAWRSHPDPLSLSDDMKLDVDSLEPIYSGGKRVHLDIEVCYLESCSRL